MQRYTYTCFLLVRKLQILKLLGIPQSQTRKLLRCESPQKANHQKLGPQIANPQIATFAEGSLI